MSEHKDIEDIIANMMASHNKAGTKKRIRSDKKGGNWERELAKVFRKRFDMDFARTPGSGSRATIGGITKEASQAMSGDLIVPDVFKFKIEAKKGYSDISLSDFYSLVKEPFGGGKPSNVKKFVGFVAQAMRDANRHDKDWMVIWRANNKPPLCAIGHALDFQTVFSFVIVKEDWVGVDCWASLPDSIRIYVYSLNDLLGMPDSFWIVQES